MRISHYIWTYSKEEFIDLTNDRRHHLVVSIAVKSLVPGTDDDDDEDDVDDDDDELHTCKSFRRCIPVYL